MAVFRYMVVVGLELEAVLHLIWELEWELELNSELALALVRVRLNRKLQVW